MRLFTSIFLILLVASGCTRKPDACLDLNAFYEVGREYRLETCSENYDFITWDFGDRSSGFIGDEAPKTFQETGNFYVQITAYSDGAYRSDDAVQLISVSKRYLDRYEIIGESTFELFRMEFGDEGFVEQDAIGTFTEEEPFIAPIWPDREVEIPFDKEQIKLFGVNNSSFTTVVPQTSINFRNNTENPIVIDGGFGLEFRLYWRYKAP